MRPWYLLTLHPDDSQPTASKKLAKNTMQHAKYLHDKLYVTPLNKVNSWIQNSKKKKVNKQIVTEVLNNNHGSKKLKWKNEKILICWLIKGKHQRNPSKICWKEEPPTRMRSILAHAAMTQGSQMIKNNFLICWFMILYNWWVNPVSKPVFDQATEFHGSDKKIDGQFSAQPHSSLSNAYITVFG